MASIAKELIQPASSNPSIPDTITIDNATLPDNDPADPPRYSDISRPIQQNASPHPWLRMPVINWSQYVLPNALVSDDRQVTVTKSAIYTADYKALHRLVHEQSLLPPRQLVRISGGQPEGYNRVHFDITLDMTPWIVRQQGDQWNYLNIPEPLDTLDTQGDRASNSDLEIERLVRGFCEDNSKNKQFVLERKVANWDSEYIAGQVRNLAAALKYEGNLSLSFPVEFSRLVVCQDEQPLNSPGWKDLWFGSKKDPALTSSVNPDVESIWPYATAAPGMDGRECAVQNEQAWWRAWRLPLRNAILSGRRGYCTFEDWVRAEMDNTVDFPSRSWGHVSRSPSNYM